MSISEIIKKKNNMTIKEYPTLPTAFKHRSIQGVIQGLIASGYQVFDVEINGQHVNMARRDEVEIYFDKKEAVYTVVDYGRIEGKSFNVNLSGVYTTGRVPEHLWCNV